MLNSQVLVLNRLYQPVHVTHARRAICMMVVGAACALDDQFRLFDFLSWVQVAPPHGEAVLRSIHLRLRIPRVVVLQTYERVPRGRIRFSRSNIFTRDQHVCQYCHRCLSRRALNLDHVIPRSQGGKTNWCNVVTSCMVCNARKGCRTPEQAGMQLLRPPQKPRWSELMQPFRTRAHYREWLPFLPFCQTQD